MPLHLHPHIEDPLWLSHNPEAVVTSVMQGLAPHPALGLLVQEALQNSGSVAAESGEALPFLSATVIFTTNAEVQKLNATYRHKDAPTNVLSFPIVAALSPTETTLGDVFLALETLQQEASEQHKSLPQHLAHMIVHGVLHLLGLDHETDDDAQIMESLEIDLLASLHIPNPYKDNVVPHGH